MSATWKRVPDSAEAELHDTFTGKPDQALTTADSGQEWTLHETGSGAHLAIIDGKLTKPDVNGNGYAQIELADDVRCIDADFTLGPYSTIGGGPILCVWKDPIAVGVAIPDSPCHLQVSLDGWAYGVWDSDGAGLAVVKSGKWATNLVGDEETLYRCAAYLDYERSAAVVLLPDGTVEVIEDSRIAEFAGPWACFEVPGDGDATDSLAQYVTVRADATDRPRDIAAVMKAARQNVDDSLTVVHRYSPAPANNVAIPGAFAWTTIDEDDVAITFDAPRSGKTLLTAELNVAMSTPVRLILGVKGPAPGFDADIGGHDVAASQFTGNVRGEVLLTGLTPGKRYTFFWRARADVAGATFRFDSANSRAAMLTAQPVA